MQFRVTNLTLPVGAPEDELPAAIARRLGVRADEWSSWRILRKSLDARSRRNLKFVYSVVVDLADDVSLKREATDLPVGVEAFQEKRFQEPEPGRKPLNERPVVVGSGPAGLAAGYYLALRGYRPLILERGFPVKERVSAIRRFDRGGPFEPENNYLFGEGGAGCFSDGKLTCRISGPDVDWVLQRFVECGARESILFEHRPHLGSNVLPLICRNFRRRIEALGGEYRFGCRFECLDIREGCVRSVQTSSGEIRTSQVVLGIGHSARDTYQMLHALGVPMSAKAFQLGLRIEQPQEQVNRHMYGNEADLAILGAADYFLVAKGERDLFSFCVCAGGVIIPSISEPEMFCTNGMSRSRHDTPFLSGGMVVTLEPHEFGSAHPLAGVELQRRYESAAFRLAGGDYLCPIQTAADFLAERSPNPKTPIRSSYQRGTRPVNMDGVIPPAIARAVRAGLPILDRKWRGDFLRNAVLTGPEMRGSSPVRIDRDRQTRQCPGIAGLYPVGEGAGYAGGIVTAAVDGLCSAKTIVESFAPLEPVGV
ncbi:MAG: FAD-dependent oxidoreductase [Planctomycetes bacterium]|nr:FAD-dependent oxidoreductase [Planctomycetota bacterium]